MGKVEELEAQIEDLRAQLYRIAKGDELKTKAAGFRLGTIRVYEDIKGILRTSGKITCHIGTAAERAASSDYQEGVFWWESDNDELFIGTGSGWQDVGGASVGGAHNFLSSTSHTDTVTQGATRGSLVVGNSTPKWDELTKGSSGNVLRMADANDPGWSAPGISDTNIVKVDGSPSDDEYPRWTGSGLEGRTAANVRSDIGLDAAAIAAVEGEATLDLTGDVTIANAKSLGVDTINEKTAAAGVTIDGSLIKDGSFYPDSGDANMKFAKVAGNLYFTAAVGEIIFGSAALHRWIFYTDTTERFRADSDGLTIAGNIIVSGTVDGVDIAARDHAQAHTVASHSDTTITGTETETLSDGSDASSLHVHKKTVHFKVLAHDTALSTGDGKEYWTVPLELNGYNLTDADAAVYTVSSSGIVGPIQIYNVTQTADMLSTGITIDATEYNSYTAATPPVIDTGNDDVATGDRLRFDVDTTAGTGTKGLDIIMVFTKP